MKPKQFRNAEKCVGLPLCGRFDVQPQRIGVDTKCIWRAQSKRESRWPSLAVEHGGHMVVVEVDVDAVYCGSCSFRQRSVVSDRSNCHVELSSVGSSPVIPSRRVPATQFSGPDVELDASVVEWLLEGDPAIRWQVKRDLLDAQFGTERKQVAKKGWGRRLLALQCEDGRWTKERGPNGYRGLYTPKWTSTTYTLLLLRRFGIEPANPQCRHGCDAIVDGSQWFDDGSVAPWNTKKTDTCVCGMFLGLLSYFDHDDTELRDGLICYLHEQQKPDGGWNCMPSNVSSVHSTLTTLEGLQLARERMPSLELDASVRRGQKYLLERHLMWSKRTGELIDTKFVRFSFPPRWKYDVLRALEHFRDTDTRDARLEEAISLVSKKRNKSGTWQLQNRHSGETHFDMEKAGKCVNQFEHASGFTSLTMVEQAINVLRCSQGKRILATHPISSREFRSSSQIPPSNTDPWRLFQSADVERQTDALIDFGFVRSA